MAVVINFVALISLDLPCNQSEFKYALPDENQQRKKNPLLHKFLIGDTGLSPDIFLNIMTAPSTYQDAIHPFPTAGTLRVSEEVEDVGMDSHHHSPPKAYAMEAQGPKTV